MTSICESGDLIDDQSVQMEDVSIPTHLTDEQKCAKLKGFEKEVHIFTARMEYVQDMHKIEKNDDTPNKETMEKLSSELQSVEKKIKPPKLTNLTAKSDKNNKESEFTLPQKTVKPVSVENNKILVPTNNSFAVLNAANNDAEDVPPFANKVKPINMKMHDKYSQILQELHRTHPTATNSYYNGYIKIQPGTSDHHREITTYLTAQKAEYFVNDPVANRPLKLVIKRLPASTKVEDIKTDLVAKGINIDKVAQLKKFADKTPLPIYMIEPRKGKGKSPNDNRKRNEIASAQIKPGLSFAQAVNPIPQHQMTARGNDTSAPSIPTPKINDNNKEAANTAKPVKNEEFGILHTQ
ncbi:uncharacterized protein TNCT_376661 [Trichonephila clavata]|uniref:Pre-C2HC domain-containing protein n=1 Tax=Trichonephila clavata TaxID=2740835 RepID=A0A8X6K3D8_TRICU|nr:uncharacterized protein TNCT_376661 [Trichonephila clavata]